MLAVIVSRPSDIC